MGRTFDVDGVAGKMAVYDEPPSGAPDGPLYNPTAHFSRIKLHSDFNYLRVSKEITKTINHPAVSGSKEWDWSTFSVNFKPEAYVNDYLLGTHGLGYIPLVIVARGQNTVEPGFPVQVNASGGFRRLDIYLTTTQVRVKEVVDSGTGTLSAVNRTYKIFVLEKPAVDAKKPLFDADSGHVIAGQGRFDSDDQFLRAVADGESPYVLGAGKMLDADGGICKFIGADGSVSYDFYESSAYGGSLTAITNREVMT